MVAKVSPHLQRMCEMEDAHGILWPNTLDMFNQCEDVETDDISLSLHNENSKVNEKPMTSTLTAHDCPGPNTLDTFNQCKDVETNDISLSLPQKNFKVDEKRMTSVLTAVVPPTVSTCK